MLKELKAAKARAEETLGFKIAKDDAAEVLKYCVRKCKLQKQDASYLPLLYETELMDYFFRIAVNAGLFERRFCDV